MKLSPREMILAGVVACAVFIVFNLVILKKFSSRQAVLREQLGVRTMELQSMHLLLDERDLWTQRAAWLTQKQPRLTDENSAAVQLLDQIGNIAKGSGVTLENKAFASATRMPSYRSVAVNLETKSSWTSLVQFLNAVQQPEQFIVFENAEIAIDPGDATQMRGKFRIARWYVP